MTDLKDNTKEAAVATALSQHRRTEAMAATFQEGMRSAAPWFAADGMALFHRASE